MLIFVPIAIAVVALLLRHSWWGTSLRATADDPDLARACSISPGRASTFAWGLAGLLAALTTILIAPTGEGGSATALGPDLLLRALVPAVIAHMASLPIALAAGLAIGVGDEGVDVSC